MLPRKELARLDVTVKVVLVTGASAGIGKAAAISAQALKTKNRGGEI